jgi:ribosomal protein L40E
MRIPRRVLGPSCPCGARLSIGDNLCRKCRAHVRWFRRKSPYPDL